MNKEKQMIEEMERDLIDSVEHETLFDVDFYITSKNLIAKDYRKVVRCKDCAQYNGHRYCQYYDTPVLDDDYCSYAKMRGE